MKRINILVALALLSIYFASKSMEERPELKFEVKEEKGDEKREDHPGATNKIDSTNKVHGFWKDYPNEIKMWILYFVLNPLIIRGIETKNSSCIFKAFKTRYKLRLTSKEMNHLVSDNQVFNIKEINRSLLEDFPDCLLEILQKGKKSAEIFQLPSGIILRKLQSVCSIFKIASSNKHVNFCKELILAGIFDGIYKDNIPLVHAIFLRDYDLVKRLVEKGITRALFTDNTNQIMMAAEIGHSDILKLLLDVRPQDIDNKDNNGSTSLSKAAFQGHKESVELLLNRGANINHKDNDNQTALMIAAFQGHKEIVELLLDRGANINEKDNDGSTALTYAAFQGHKEIVELLLDKGANINEKHNDGSTALMKAAFQGYKEAVELLLDRGANVNEKDNNGSTALIFAATKGHKEAAALLLDRGAYVDEIDNYNRTALMFAAYHGHKEVIELLLDRGANIDEIDNNNRTALMGAAYNGHKETVEVLLDRGADATIAWNDGRTALTLAHTRGHQEVAQILQNHLDLLAEH